MSKIKDWEYPYDIWPEDYSCQDKYTDKQIDKIATKYSFADKNKLKEVILFNALVYLGDEDFYGKNSNSSSALKDEMVKLQKYLQGAKERLNNLSTEAYEGLIYEMSDTVPEDCSTTSYYLEKKFNAQTSGINAPSLEEFYGAYDGFNTFNESREHLTKLCDLFTEASAGIIEDPRLFSPHKTTRGIQTKPLEGYISEMYRYWLEEGKEPARIWRTTTLDDETNKNKVTYVCDCLDFIMECLLPIKPSSRDLDDRKDNNIRTSAGKILQKITKQMG